MTRLDARVRAWAWMLQRAWPVSKLSEARLVAMQSRGFPDNALTARLFGTTPPGVEVSDRTIAGPGGDLPIRVYRPRSGPAALSLVVNFHGGGFVTGDLRMSDWVAGSVAARVGAVVVSVAYRLAPAHPFPAAVDDAYAGVEWAAAHADELGTGRLGVMGESAGGNLAAVVCLLARERGGPAISHQALLYPATDMTATGLPSDLDRPWAIVTPADAAAYHRHYLGATDPSDPRVSPRHAADHSGLPPALVQVAEHDLLRQQGIDYAAKLRAAGVPVRLTEYVGMPHGYLNFPGICRGAPQALAELCAEQRSALIPSAAPQPEGDRPAPHDGRLPR